MNFNNPIFKFFKGFGIPYKTIVIFFILAACISGYLGSKIEFDISPDAVALKRDLQSVAYQKANLYFNDNDQLAIIIDQTKPFQHLKTINVMVHELERTKMVSSVYAITNVPLLFSPKLYLFQLIFELPTLQSPRTNLKMAKKELTDSPFYKRMLLDKSNDLTSILINIDPPSAKEIRNNQQFAKLNFLKTQRHLTQKETTLLEKTRAIDHQNKLKRNQELSVLLSKVQKIVNKHAHLGDIYIVGMPAISQTIIDYLKADLFNFGITAFILMAFILFMIFKRIKDGFIALMSSFMVVLFALGTFSYLHWPLTIVSANFPPILFVISLTFIIYIILRFDEVAQRRKNQSQATIIKTSVKELKTPIAYSALTTMVGFLSLTLCNIQPIIDFGVMMSIAIPIAYLICFLFIPCLWACFKKQKTRSKKTRTWPNKLIIFIENYRKTILWTACFLVVFFTWGATYITVENRFVDYFTSNTRMVQSIKIIDDKLAGTSTLDILLDYPKDNYWIEPNGISQLKKLQVFLNKQPEINKTLSIYTMIETLNMVHGEPLSTSLLRFSLNSLSKQDKEALVDPYLTNNGRLARVVIYLPDSNPDLKRDDLIDRINTYLHQHITPKATHQITGLYWLYNNVLQSLLNAQISILFWVYLVIGCMLLFLFKDARLMMCALLPNIIPMCMVFGSLGWLKIPLDFMTITIAGISLGLAVDFAIQFIYRFKQEHSKHTFRQSISNTYESIGYAIMTTTITIIVGFSVMLLSHFKPLVYFSLLSGLSILMACISTLTILPILLSKLYQKENLTKIDQVRS